MSNQPGPQALAKSTKHTSRNTGILATIQGGKQEADAMSLALEIQYMVLDHTFFNYHYSNAAYRFTPPDDVLTAFQVCRAWYAHAQKLFYCEIYFYKPLMYYRFATSLLQGPPKGMGKDIGRLVRKVIFEVPREENIHWSVFLTRPRFASISRAIEAILRCCPLITWIEIRGCFAGGIETTAVTRVMRDHSKALRITYNTNVGLVLCKPHWHPTKYNDPAQFPYGAWVSLQRAPGSFQTAALFDTLSFEYKHIHNMQNLQRLDLSLELSSATFAVPEKQDYTIAASLSEFAISILNIEVHFRDWYLDELEHTTLTHSGAENFFGLIAQNSHLKRFEIVSLHIPPQCRYWSPVKHAVHQPPEYKALQGLEAAKRAEGHLKTWIESDPTGRLRKIVKLGRKVVDTVFPTPTDFYQGVDMPPYYQCRTWYDRFTRQYKKVGNLERFKLSEPQQLEVAAELEKYKLRYLK